jgi:acyl-CoA thioester hydrolase
VKIRVYYEDTDAGRIVYHTNYIKYCERARSEVFFKKNMTPTLGEDSGFVVRNISANFLATATLGDMLNVTSKLLSLKSSSLVLIQEVWKDKIKVFSMEVVLVYVNKGKPSRIPEVFRDTFESF